MPASSERRIEAPQRPPVSWFSMYRPRLPVVGASQKK